MHVPRPTDRARHVVKLTRTYAAPREQVFAAFTDPDLIALWWGPDGFRTPRETVAVELRAGGRHHKDMVVDDAELAEAMGISVGTAFPDRATIVDVDAPSLLVLRSEPQPQIGFVEPTLTRIELHAEGSAARVELIDGPYGDEMAPNAELGWRQQLERLAAIPLAPR
jgi:uncharacterized protein YndB with AHSA1/START domain